MLAPGKVGRMKLSSNPVIPANTMSPESVATDSGRDKMTIMHFLNLKTELIEKVLNADSKESLETLRIFLLGKNGEVTRLIKSLAVMPPEEKIASGKLINEIKKEVESAINKKAKDLSSSSGLDPNLDLSLPGHKPIIGRLHPTTLVVNEMNEIFKHMGFSVAQGPEIEDDEYNYNRLNLPPDHPARDLQDTLYIKEPDVLLRTHTSSIEAHILEDFKPPYRFVIPGKVYRYENANATNNIMFYQYQGLAIGMDITMAHLKGTLNSFVTQFFGKDVETRFRCKYYPEVEPGVGVDISCTFCGGEKGCMVCKHRGWIEMLGAGMVHPNMLVRVGLNPQEVSGFAWGMGLDRIVMTKFGISDVRSLYNGDILYT
jgi:phenylalanyl-tRNA synthetase alpha chain